MFTVNHTGLFPGVDSPDNFAIMTLYDAMHLRLMREHGSECMGRNHGASFELWSIVQRHGGLRDATACHDQSVIDEAFARAA